MMQRKSYIAQGVLTARVIVEAKSYIAESKLAGKVI